MSNQLQYCNNMFEYSRLITREVKVGDLLIGGTNPIRVQSMTTTNTMDTIKTVEQSIRMINAGCELVRITAPSLNEAKNLETIKNELEKRGYKTPLCADIHFTPNAAEYAARIVQKVRVNPGNYADKKKFEHIEYTDKSYEEELERIRERFLPLVKICKEYGTAMRIGTNHGSLSDRILSRYGDTPQGMVESAFEFLRICESENYYNIVLSMKASNPQVMVQAYRLLAHKMIERNSPEYIYPLHLGVTEAGDGEDGRIKSAVGIGTLLEDGLGDTIRVSLTEEPEFEIPVAKNIAQRYDQLLSAKENVSSNNISKYYSPFEYTKRQTTSTKNIGNKNVPRIVADFSFEKNITPATLLSVGYDYSATLDKWNIADQACDYIYLGNNTIDFETPGTLALIYNYENWQAQANETNAYPLFTVSSFIKENQKSHALNFVVVSSITEIDTVLKHINTNHPIVLVFESKESLAMQHFRSMFFHLLESKCTLPVILKRTIDNSSEEKFQLYASIDFGGLLLDGFADGLWAQQLNGLQQKLANTTLFGILQATRTRISKTEYISCPSCGRTLFDLQETTAKIRARTSHLKGIKIGIMGCIVNGPGEMADADYGYVGTGVGKITLYKGKTVVKRNVAADNAVDELINLIKENGDWVDIN